MLDEKNYIFFLGRKYTRLSTNVFWWQVGKKITQCHRAGKLLVLLGTSGRYWDNLNMELFLFCLATVKTKFVLNICTVDRYSSDIAKII